MTLFSVHVDAFHRPVTSRIQRGSLGEVEHGTAHVALEVLPPGPCERFFLHPLYLTPRLTLHAEVIDLFVPQSSRHVLRWSVASWSTVSYFPRPVAAVYTGERVVSGATRAYDNHGGVNNGALINQRDRS